MKMNSAHISLLALMASSSGAIAQQSGGQLETLHRSIGQQATELHGAGMTGLDDVDLDGYDDYAISSMYVGSGSLNSGQVEVFSGQTNAVLYTLSHGAHFDSFGRSLANVGDVDGDGISDLLVGAPTVDSALGLLNAGAAYVYSGATGTLLLQMEGTVADHRFGEEVYAASDINGDGFGDLLVAAAPGTGTHREVYVFDGVSGALLHQLLPSGNDRFNGEAIGIGDIDGDGQGEIVVPGHTAFRPLEQPEDLLLVYSGATGALLKRHSTGSLPENRISGVNDCSDVDGDGNPDFLYAVNGMGQGTGYVISSSTLQVLLQFESDQLDGHLGADIEQIDDFDGDGMRDYFMSGTVGTEEDTTYEIFSGADGRSLFIYQNEGSIQAYAKVLSVGDVNADGHMDYSWAQRTYADSSNDLAGLAEIHSVISAMQADAQSLSASAGGSIVFELDFLTDQAGEDYRLLGSTRGLGPVVQSGIAIPLTSTGILWDALSAPASPSWVPTSIGTLDVNGDATVTAVIPAGAMTALVGQSVAFAAVSIPAGSGRPVSASSISIIISIQP